MYCKHEGCGRRTRSRGWCSTHYRRWRSGKPMGASIRSYVRVDMDDGGLCVPQTLPMTPRKKREKPFAAERALLAELGLGR